MTRAVLDDHLLRDLLTGEISSAFEAILTDHEPATAEHLRAPLCIWDGDDGPRIRAAMAAVGQYRVLPRDP